MWTRKTPIGWMRIVVLVGCAVLAQVAFSGRTARATQPVAVMTTPSVQNEQESKQQETEQKEDTGETRTETSSPEEKPSRSYPEPDPECVQQFSEEQRQANPLLAYRVKTLYVLGFVERRGTRFLFIQVRSETGDLQSLLVRAGQRFCDGVLRSFRTRKEGQRRQTCAVFLLDRSDDSGATTYEVCR